MCNSISKLSRTNASSSLLTWLVFLAGCLLTTPMWANDSASEHRSGIIGKGQAWETFWHVYDSGVPGPVIMVVGGIHGNEPAGALAALQIKNWQVEKGKLVVIPQANQLGLKANLRWIPAYRNDRKLRDLNRNFPRLENPRPRTEIANDIWDFIKDQEPDWFFDLHEGFDFHRLNPKSVGSSVITFPEETQFAKQLADAANQHMAEVRRFSVLSKSGPAQGSLARACGEQLGAKSFILETTFKDQAISQRTRQHRAMLAQALKSIGVTQKDWSQQFVPPQRPGRAQLNVGVFDAAGANPANVMKAIDRESEIEGFHLGPADFNAHALLQFDVLLFPGGSGSKQGRALGDQRRELIRKFTRNGGGIVGICAGAYLCTSHYDWSLNLMNAKVYNEMVEIPGKGRKSMWYRGGATEVEVELTPKAETLFGLGGRHSIRYQNGPIISRGTSEHAPDYEILAYFRSENFLYEVQKGTMINRPAILQSRYGEGRVLAFSPHFESTHGKEEVVINAIKSVARSKDELNFP